MSEPHAALERFSAPTRTWFAAAFAAPTPGPGRAPGRRSRAGQHALVVAPTGSGKTLAAFLWAIDRLLTEPRPADETDAARRVLYVSPLKALAVDVERNLRRPLAGIRQTAERLGARLPEVTVGIRSGDTPAAERRTPGAHAARHPDHHARVAVPDADQPGPREPARRRDRDRRRGARGRRHQARRPPRGSASSGSTRCSTGRPSGSGCPRRCGRSTRSPASSAARRRSRSSRRPRPSSGTSRSSSRSRT